MVCFANGVDVATHVSGTNGKLRGFLSTEFRIVKSSSTCFSIKRLPRNRNDKQPRVTHSTKTDKYFNSEVKDIP